jgi:signal transduction histidine kinase
MESGFENKISASATAHEFRNPIHNIYLSCEQLGTELSEFNIPEERVLVYLDIIKRNCIRINELVADLFHSPEESNTEESSLEKILQESLALAADRIKLNSIRLERHFFAKEYVCFKNCSLLKMAFLNIIINAIESMEGSGGTLKVSIEQKNDLTEVSIADTGTGIPGDSIEKIFIAHYSKKERGLGMGLAISKEIFNRNNAKIRVESEPGIGTTFIISFKNPNDEKAKP